MLEQIAKELCTLRHPDRKRPGQCLYVWDLMGEDHRQEFLDAAKCCIRLIIKELQTMSDRGVDDRTYNAIEDRINELKKISA